VVGLKAVAGAILVAAGSGRRLKSKTRKAFVPLAGKPLFQWSLQVLERSAWVGEITLVVHAGDVVRLGAWVREHRKVRVVEGGEERQDSVQEGLRALQGSWPVILVHDAARPFASQELVQACVESALKRGSGIAAVPVKDSIKRLRQGKVSGLPRHELWAAQTPQAIRREWLEAAYAWAAKKRFLATDEAGLLEAFGKPVTLVESSDDNFKVTTPVDLKMAGLIAKRPSPGPSQREG
jgi:2-C-methyl-D-erythritol 4-phosphate cytidylyltransferase